MITDRPEEDKEEFNEVDDIYDEPVDHAEIKRTQADALLPEGLYVTVPPINYRTYQAQATRRRLILFFGPVAWAGSPRATGVVKSITWQMSPDVRFRSTGDIDNPTKLWNAAVAANTQAVGTQPETVKDVVEFLRDFPVQLRIIRIGVPTKDNPTPAGDPKNLVVHIRAVTGG